MEEYFKDIMPYVETFGYATDLPFLRADPNRRTEYPRSLLDVDVERSVAFVEDQFDVIRVGEDLEVKEGDDVLVRPHADPDDPNENNKPWASSLDIPWLAHVDQIWEDDDERIWVSLNWYYATARDTNVAQAYQNNPVLNALLDLREVEQTEHTDAQYDPAYIICKAHIHGRREDCGGPDARDDGVFEYFSERRYDHEDGSSILLIPHESATATEQPQNNATVDSQERSAAKDSRNEAPPRSFTKRQKHINNEKKINEGESSHSIVVEGKKYYVGDVVRLGSVREAEENELKWEFEDDTSRSKKVFCGPLEHLDDIIYIDGFRFGDDTTGKHGATPRSIICRKFARHNSDRCWDQEDPSDPDYVEGTRPPPTPVHEYFFVDRQIEISFKAFAQRIQGKVFMQFIPPSREFVLKMYDKKYDDELPIHVRRPMAGAAFMLYFRFRWNSNRNAVEMFTKEEEAIMMACFPSWIPCIDRNQFLRGSACQQPHQPEGLSSRSRSSSSSSSASLNLPGGPSPFYKRFIAGAPKWRALRLYAGAGNLDVWWDIIGLISGGSVVECDEKAATAYLDMWKRAFSNAPESEIPRKFVEDASNFLRKCLNCQEGYPQPGDFEMLIAGPPCQPFSFANRYPDTVPAQYLKAEFPVLLSMMVYFRPKVAIIENVFYMLHRPAGPTTRTRDESESDQRFAVKVEELDEAEFKETATFKKGDVESVRFFQNILVALRALGYNYRMICIRNQQVGLCSNRERVFIVATKAGRDGLMPPDGKIQTHAIKPDPTSFITKDRSAKKGPSGLGVGGIRIKNRAVCRGRKFWDVFGGEREGNSLGTKTNASNYAPWPNTAALIVPIPAQDSSGDEIITGDGRKRTDKARPCSYDDISIGTVMTKKQMVLHPDNRPFTTDELKVLQGLDPSFFQGYGSNEDIKKQIGNSVSAPMALTLAVSCYVSWFEPLWDEMDEMGWTDEEDSDSDEDNAEDCAGIGSSTAPVAAAGVNERNTMSRQERRRAVDHATPKPTLDSLSMKDDREGDGNGAKGCLEESPTLVHEGESQQALGIHVDMDEVLVVDTEDEVDGEDNTEEMDEDEDKGEEETEENRNQASFVELIDLDAEESGRVNVVYDSVDEDDSASISKSRDEEEGNGSDAEESGDDVVMRLGEENGWEFDGVAMESSGCRDSEPSRSRSFEDDKTDGRGDSFEDPIDVDDDRRKLAERSPSVFVEAKQLHRLPPSRSDSAGSPIYGPASASTSSASARSTPSSNRPAIAEILRRVNFHRTSKGNKEVVKKGEVKKEKGTSLQMDLISRAIAGLECKPVLPTYAPAPNLAPEPHPQSNALRLVKGDGDYFLIQEEQDDGTIVEF
ncbi:DNA (cytosine-5)-methyltransferase 1 [Quaeritorhiza haematococci]|nr:DNA (cytosine-5)-methyltransferase 1 [Quaeritorhiza haematococci]